MPLVPSESEPRSLPNESVLLGEGFLPWGFPSGFGIGACILLGANCPDGLGVGGVAVGANGSVESGLALDGSSLRIVLENAESIGDGVGDRLLDGFGGAVVGTAEGTGA